MFQNRLPCPVIVRLNRLFRLPRMWEWFDRTETATSFPNAFRICKVWFVDIVNKTSCLKYVLLVYNMYSILPQWSSFRTPSLLCPGVSGLCRYLLSISSKTMAKVHEISQEYFMAVMILKNIIIK